MPHASCPRLVALVGPTGVGKTELGIRLAGDFGAEIISADSRQVYRGLDIGSAKPAPAQRAAVAHFVVDVVDPGERFDCARFRREAKAAIADITGRGKRVLVVGGTGLYVKVLRHGLFAGPARDDALRARLAAAEARAPGAMYAKLQAVDPAAAARLHPHDHSRLLRALEVYELTGRPISVWQAEHGFRENEFDIVALGLSLPRPLLYERINARCGAMVQAGLVDEVQRLYASGLDPALPCLQSPGYREIGEYVRGQSDLDGAIARMSQATRRLAKRQLTWFRADPSVSWCAPDIRVLGDAVRTFWG